MIDYKNYLTNFIRTGLFNYDDMSYKIYKLWVEGKITEADRDELLALSAEYASDSQQIDLFERIVALEHRIIALETADIPVWVSGYVTQKGETVKFDYDNDGVLDLLRYDGGRASTALSCGKIDGWHVVDSEGNILGTYYQGVFTPVEEEVGE